MLRDKFLLIFYLDLLLISHFHDNNARYYILTMSLTPNFFLSYSQKDLGAFAIPKAIKNYSKPKDYQKLLHPDLVWVQC